MALLLHDFGIADRHGETHRLNCLPNKSKVVCPLHYQENSNKLYAIEAVLELAEKRAQPTQMG